MSGAAPDCGCHCSACGRCFATLEAFDWHRVGSYKAGRRCVDPARTRRGEMKPAPGRCPVVGRRGGDVEVWSLP